MTKTPSQPGTGQRAAIPVRRIDHSFEEIAPETFEAKLAVSEPNTGFEHFKRFFLGQPIPERLAQSEQLNRARALAILSSDGLSSVAYGTEASLAVLIVAGVAALGLNLPIGLAVVVLMAIVAASYRQTIFAYPTGGGSYIVASRNLNPTLGLIAAAALLIDYLLTVSVSVAAGIDAIVSALPLLRPVSVILDLAAIALITLINARGVREAGRVFAIPTFFFLGSYGLMIVLGLGRALFNGGLFHPAVVGSSLPPGHPVNVAQILAHGNQPITALLILTAFASGCSAMTGIEAISNGVQIFKGRTPQEQARNAAATLATMIALLMSLYAGTTYLAWRVGALPFPDGQPTVTSQIAIFAYGGWLQPLFYLVQIATLLILIFAANTSFAGFPRLCAILAQDSYLPVLFQYRGERVAFNAGILTLGILSAVVLVIFRGNVADLINLYALGVFTAFTLSQAGMVKHWLDRRETEPRWRTRVIINGIGMVATGIVTLIITVTKFDRGGWVVVVLVPLLVLMFKGTAHYYARPRQLLLDQVHPEDQQSYDVIVIPIFSHRRIRPAADAVAHSGSQARRTRQWPAVIDQEIDFAAALHPGEIVVLVVAFNETEAESLRQEWKDYLAAASQRTKLPIKLEIIISPYRTIVQPVANFIRDQVKGIYADRSVGVMLPRQIETPFWELPLRRRAADRVHLMLRQDRVDGAHVIDLPFRLMKRH